MEQLKGDESKYWQDDKMRYLAKDKHGRFTGPHKTRNRAKQVKRDFLQFAAHRISVASTKANIESRRKANEFMTRLNDSSMLKTVETQTMTPLVQTPQVYQGSNVQTPHTYRMGTPMNLPSETDTFASPKFKRYTPSNKLR